MSTETLINNKSISIIGRAGIGKTARLQKLVEEIQNEHEEVKIISINCSDSELVHDATGVIKNVISSDFIFTEEKADIELLDTKWQDLVFDRRPSDIYTECFEVLTKRIKDFVETSNVPSVIIVEEIWMFSRAMKYLIELSNYVTGKGGYFLSTACYWEEEKVGSFLNSVDEVIDLRDRRYI